MGSGRGSRALCPPAPRPCRLSPRLVDDPTLFEHGLHQRVGIDGPPTLGGEARAPRALLPEADWGPPEISVRNGPGGAVFVREKDPGEIARIVADVPGLR